MLPAIKGCQPCVSAAWFGVLSMCFSQVLQAFWTKPFSVAWNCPGCDQLRPKTCQKVGGCLGATHLASLRTLGGGSPGCLGPGPGHGLNHRQPFSLGGVVSSDPKQVPPSFIKVAEVSVGAPVATAGGPGEAPRVTVLRVCPPGSLSSSRPLVAFVRVTPRPGGAHSPMIRFPPGPRGPVP